MDAHELDHQRLAELQQSTTSTLETITSALEAVNHQLLDLQQRLQALEDRANYAT
jgi:predicted  nucleic acid-binding Zn-ribbon protein